MIQFPDSLEIAPVMQIVGPVLQEWRHILDHHLYTNVFGQIETMQLIVPAAVVDVDVVDIVLQEWRHILDHHLYPNVFGQIETMQLIVPAAVVDVDVADIVVVVAVVDDGRDGD